MLPDGEEARQGSNRIRRPDPPDIVLPPIQRIAEYICPPKQHLTTVEVTGAWICLQAAVAAAAGGSSEQ